jgi:23S rRNA (pseudouridine1915-N3)-methyltransferase
VKLLVVAVGRRMPAWITAGFDEYAKRMPPQARLSLVEIRPEHRGAAAGQQATERMLQAEHKRIAAALPADCIRVVLDERGRQLSTRQLAQRLERWRGSGRDVAFIIGGADGTTPALRGQAHLLWSLTSLTLPHGLARVLLAEQLYRAVSILNNHPYHRE